MLDSAERAGLGWRTTPGLSGGRTSGNLGIDLAVDCAPSWAYDITTVDDPNAQPRSVQGT
ncbi:hypothetical protein JOF35_005240 [Streptomyces demainii]|uniref:Uncharacterized protein n=1 Tax=Streptomyces demainii TaxID=588122 RepID=A0ABT9KWZ1_9ACTN|nr:hypothetical protein [Streptomyces demainii]